MKEQAPALAIILALIILPALAYFFFPSPMVAVAHLGYVPVTARNDPGGTVEIYYEPPGSTSWIGPFNTTTTETIWVPLGSNVEYVFVPQQGFAFYEAVGTATITSTTYIFYNVTHPITETAYFPVMLTIIQPEIWDYITTSHAYYISFIGELAYDNNMSPVPASVASYLAPYMKLFVSVTPVGGSPVSGSVKLQQSGSILYVSDAPLFTVYDPNGLSEKYATINFSSPDPYLYYTKFAWSANDWAWGIEITVTSGNSVVDWQMPYSSSFSLTGYVPTNSQTSLYFPSGASVTFTDAPSPGYAFTGWTEEIIYSGTSKQVFYPTSNPFTITLPSTSFAQAYTGPYYYLIANTQPTSITFNIQAPSALAGKTVTIYLTMPNGTVTNESTQLTSYPGGTVATAYIKWSYVPLGTYSWYISPSSLTYSSYGTTTTVSAQPSSGSFTLGANNGSITLSVVYTTKLDTVTFTESGLPSGVTWWVVLGNVNKSATAPNSIVFTNVPQGSSLSYYVDSPIIVNGNTEYTASSSQGTIGVSGNMTETISYSTSYLVSVVYKSGLGTSNPTSVWVPAGATETFELTPEEDYYIPKPYSSYITTSSSALSVQYSSISKTTSGNTYVYNVPVVVNGPGTVYIDAQWFDFVEYITANGYPSSGWQFEVYQNGQLYASNTVYGSQGEIVVPGYDYSANSYYEYTITFPVVQSGNVYYVPSIISTSSIYVLSENSSAVTFYITGNAYNNSNIITIAYTPYEALTINAGSGGSVSWSIYQNKGSVYGGATSGTVSQGSSQTIYVVPGTYLELKANPASGYSFSSWSVSSSISIKTTSNSNPIVIEATGSGSITAVYSYTYSWSITGLKSGDTATLSVGSNSYTVYNGKTVTLTFYTSQGSVSWSASNSKDGASPQPSSGTVSGPGSTTIQYTYSLQITSFTASPPANDGQTTVTVSWSFTGGVAPYTVTVTDSQGNTLYSSSTSSTSGAQSYTYPAPSSAETITFYITVTSSNGQSASAQTSVTIYPAMSATISADFYTISVNSQDTFYVTVSGGSGNFEYDFYIKSPSGSTTSSGWITSNTYTTTFSSAGTYTVYAVVQDMTTGQKVQTGSVSITVVSQFSISSFTVTPTVHDGQTTVTISWSLSGGTAPYNVQITDSLGDFIGTSSKTSGSMTYTYSAPSQTETITITIQAYSGNGATAKASQTITIYPALSATISASNTNPSANTQVTFTVSVSGGSGNFEYDFYITSPSGSTTSSGWQTSNTYTTSFSSGGNYKVYAVVQDLATGQTAQTNTITISVPAYSVTFTESGLPLYNSYTNGRTTPVKWSITIAGSTYTADAGQSITVNNLASGQTYTWTAENPVVVTEYGNSVDYYANPSSGQVSGPTTVQIKYSDPQTCIKLSSFNTLKIVILGNLLLALVFMGLELCMRRRPSVIFKTSKCFFSASTV